MLKFGTLLFSSFREQNNNTNIASIVLVPVIEGMTTRTEIHGKKKDNQELNLFLEDDGFGKKEVVDSTY